MNFGIILKNLRKENKITQVELAKKLNIPRATLSNYELGLSGPSFENLEKIGNYFNVSIDYLLGKTKIKNEEELKKMKFANEGGININTEGLNISELLELQKLADFMRYKKIVEEKNNKDNKNK